MNAYLNWEDASSQAADDAQRIQTLELLQVLEWAEETLGELESQFGSEVSMYGDAWPGAALRVESCLENVNRIRRTLNLPLRANRLGVLYGRQGPSDYY